MNTDKSDLFNDDFASMLAGNSGMEALPPKESDVLPIEMKPQYSIGMASFYNSMVDQPRVGDTGTTPRNDYSGLMMNRNNNISLESRNGDYP
jgi:hypothetical protein